MPRSLRWAGAGLLVATVLAWGLALALPSRTTVQVVITPAGAEGRVNGAEETLALPPAAPSAPASFGWYLAAPSDSLYYQPADPSAPLVSWGRLNEWLQGLRPAPHWEFTPGTTPAGAPNTPGPWQMLYGTADGGAAAAVDPQSASRPTAHLNAVLVGGRMAAGLLVQVDGAGNGYAFVVRPERRGIAWWRVAGGVPVEQLDSSTYRPDLWASVADLIQEAALALTGALLLLALALLLAVLWAAFSRPSPVASPALGFAAGPGVRDQGVGVSDEGIGDGEHELRAPQAPLDSLQEPPQFKTQNSKLKTLTWLPPLAIGLLGLAAAAAVCLGPLQGIPHVQDDVAYLWQAKIFALGRAWVPAPPFKEFFDAGFVLIDNGRWFTKYPPGWPLLLVPGVWAGVPWLINPLCAGASLALIYAIGRRLYGAAAGFWAAVLGLTSPFFLFMSGSFMSHPSTLLAGTAAAYCFVRLKTAGREPPAVVMDAVREPSDPPQALRITDFVLHIPRSIVRNTLWALGTGFCLSWAFISREATAVGIAVPFVVWGLVDSAGALRAFLHGGPGRGRAAGRRLAPYVWAVVGALPPLVVLGVVNQALLGSPFELAQALVGTYDRLGFGPGFGPEEGGHTPALGLYNGIVYLRTLAGVLGGWPALLAFAPLLITVAALPGQGRRAARWDLFLLGGFLGLAGIYFAWWSATTIFGPRYWYEGLPFLLLLSGRGIALLSTGVAALVRGAAGRARLAGTLIPALLIGVLVVFDLAQVLPGQVRAYTGYNDVDASSLQRVAAAHLDHALVFVALQPAYPRRDYGKVFFANDPLLRGPVVYVRDVDRIHNAALAANFPDRTPYYLPLDGPPHPGVAP